MMERMAGRIMLLDGWRRAGLAFLAGVLATFALAPYDFPLVGFLAFPVLVWLLDGAAGDPGRSALRRLAPSFRIGWSFGFGYFLGGLWWLGSAILVDAGEFWWALPFAVLGLPAVLAIYFGLAAAFARLFWSEGAARILALAFAFTLAEYARGVLFTGFPWNQIGMMAASTPLMMQSLSLVGLHGLTFAALLVFCSPALLAGRTGARGRMAMGALAVLLCAGHLGYGALRLSQEAPGLVPDVSLRIVQPNILQSQKWDPEEVERIYSTLLSLTAARDGTESGETLVVWPESAFPFIFTDWPDAAGRLADTLEEGETLLAGAARAEGSGTAAERLFYNSLLVVDENATIQDARDKVHLVPFGEYLPFQEELEGLGISQLTQLPGGFSAGVDRTPLTLAGGLSFLSLICYEILFQDEIEGLADPATRPGFILNVTNDAWYGQTPGPWQHLRHAQASAVTYGLPLVRAANTGISVVTDAYGREIAGLGLGEGGVIRSSLPLPLAGTPFAEGGNRVVLLAMLVAFFLSVVAAFRRRD